MKFTSHNVAVLAGLVAIFIVAGCLGAFPHDWYPTECCKGTNDDGDCKPVPSKDLRPTGDGCWEYIPVGIKFCDKQVRSSPDGMYHVCNRGSNGYCVFIPPGT